ncbi:MAG TPA: ATP-binding protein [Pseudacidobacterium sp.]|nr:ATP-binding protein [Pseudacidobacterium sp.]
MFEPFFTTKPLGIGTGLGLDIANRVVTGHYEGHIGFTSEPGKTEFIVKLPMSKVCV